MNAVQLTMDTAHLAVDDWQELASRDGDGLEIALRGHRGATLSPLPDFSGSSPEVAAAPRRAAAV